MKDHDTNGDGKVQKEEFKKAYKTKNPKVSDEKIEATFTKLDCGKKGHLTPKELEGVYANKGCDGKPVHEGKDMDPKKMKEHLMTFDANGDKKIDAKEFATAYKSADPKATDDTINGIFAIGDCDKSKDLDEKEIDMLIAKKNCDGKPLDDEGGSNGGGGDGDGKGKKDKDKKDGAMKMMVSAAAAITLAYAI